MRGVAFTLFFGLFFVLTGTHAQSPEVALGDADVVQAYVEGDFEGVANLADEVMTADAFGVAARALLAKSIVENRDPTQDEVNRAEAYARRAIDMDPHHQEGRLQLAISLSMRTRQMSKIEAWQSGLGQQARTLAESVIEDAPENPYADGYLSVWHVEAVRIGGRFGASFIGASVKTGRAHYKRANVVNPDDVGLHWQYARSLTLLNAKKYRREIEQALARALAAGRDNAVEEVFYRRAYELHSALNAGEMKAALALAASQL